MTMYIGKPDLKHPTPPSNLHARFLYHTPILCYARNIDVYLYFSYIGDIVTHMMHGMARVTGEGTRYRWESHGRGTAVAPYHTTAHSSQQRGYTLSMGFHGRGTAVAPYHTTAHPSHYPAHQTHWHISLRVTLSH